jgi:hypothetical protein
MHQNRLETAAWTGQPRRCAKSDSIGGVLPGKGVRYGFVPTWTPRSQHDPVVMAP